MMNKKIILAFLAAVSVCSFLYADENMSKGSRLYEKNDFKGAAESFLKALAKKPDDPVVNYNLASSYYKSGDFADALSSYENVLNKTNDINLKSAVLYNMGNCAYRQGDKKLALNYYKASLKLNSSDIQTKHNIEFLQSDKNKNDKKNDDKNNKNEKDKDKQQQNGKDKEEREQQKQSVQNEQDKQKENQQAGNRYLLDYFDQQDKRNQNRQKPAAVSQKRGGKTW